MNDSDVTILVCCHKKDYYYDGLGFLPIQVGKSLSNIDLGITGDDTGDNISELNPYFCELTAQYWYWKNGKKTKYIGLNHYRRYFDFNIRKHCYLPVINTSEESIKLSPPHLPDLDSLFKKYDIVLAQPTTYPYSLRFNYCYAHIIDDYEILDQVIKNKFSDYYKSFKEVMNASNKLPHFNMFITKNEIFDNYTKWIFDVLFEVKKHVKISQYPFQARVFGYMSERLIKVYIKKHKLRVYYSPVRKICNDRNESLLLSSIKGLRHDFIFNISKIGTKNH